MKIYKLLTILIFLTVVFSCANNNKKKIVVNKLEHKIYDTHVHIMSNHLVKTWKALGVPFSKPAYYYTNIDSIIKTNNTEKINLIGMSYVYSNPEFYTGNYEYEMVKNENDYVLDVSKKYPKRITPYFAVHPLKNYALDEIKRCLQENTASGLKLHFSSSQVYLTVPEHLKKIKAVFKLASTHNLPILLHFDNWHPKFGKPDVELLVNSVLADVKNVNLTIAHFGSSGGFNQKTKNVIDAFIELYKNNTIAKNHTIYFDISAVALDKNSEGVQKLSTKEFAELKTYCEKLGFTKIVFGTDYPLYTAQEYYTILKHKLKLTDKQLQDIVFKK